MELWKFAILLLFLGKVQPEIRKFRIFPKVISTAENKNNHQCGNHILQWRENLKNYTLWAHKMLDSSSKSTFGVLQANSFQFGDYEECLNIVTPYEVQYCLVTITINTLHVDHAGLNRTIFTKLQSLDPHQLNRRDSVNVGVCLPASCSPAELQNFLKLKNLSKNETLDFALTANKALCTRGSKQEVMGSQKIAIGSFTLFLIFLVVLGSVVKAFVKSETVSRSVKLLFSLSVQQTWSRLFKFHENEETKIFDGVRCLTILTIVIIHLLQSLFYTGPWLNRDVIIENSHARFLLLLEKVDLSVDTFFTISGLLLSYKILQLPIVDKINPFKLILLRYLRLIPLHGYVTLLIVTIDYVKSGPISNILEPHLIENCKSNWHWNFLLINNWMTDLHNACNPPTWFICCDMQLFVMGLFLTLLIRSKAQMGHIVSAILFVVSIIAPFGILYVYNITPYFGVTVTDNYNKYMKLYYIKPYNHASCYLIGIYGGIIYQKLSSQKVKISQNYANLILATSAFCMAFSFGYLYMFYSGKNHIIEMSLYGALNRPLWALGVLGMMIAFSFGPPTSTMKQLLSWSFWIPISKLSYAVYLIHSVVLYSMRVRVNTVQQLSYFNMATFLTDLLIFTLCASLFLVIFIETSIITILKVAIMEPLSCGTLATRKTEKTDK